MKRVLSSLPFVCAVTVSLLALSFSAVAASKKAADASVSAPVASDAAAPGVTVPVTVPASAPPPAPAKSVEAATTDPISFGDLTISHPQIITKGNHIDIFLSIKNASKGDERLGGADTNWKSAGIVEVTKDKDGKETEGAVSITLPAEKSVELTASSGTWLRMTDVGTEPKSSDVVPVTLYFRRSPNAVLKIAAGKSGASAAGSESDNKSTVLDWLKH